MCAITEALEFVLEQLAALYLHFRMDVWRMVGVNSAHLALALARSGEGWGCRGYRQVDGSITEHRAPSL